MLLLGQMQDLKVYSYIDRVIDAYREPVMILEGINNRYGNLVFNMRYTLAKIEFYSNDQYMTGALDELGREKPFYNISNYRVTVAKTATDLDVKDIKFEPDSLKYSVQAMLYNHELFQYLKDTEFSNTLNEMGKTRPKYGGVLVKKCYEEDGMEIEVVDWKNTSVDPVNIMGGIIIESHYMSASEFSSKSDVWENVEEVLKAHAKYSKNKPAKIEILEATGSFPESFDPEMEDGSEYKFKDMCFYLAKVGTKKYYLYKEDISVEDKYKYLAWDRVPGRGLGRGIVEDGFEAQWATNDAMISMKNAMELSGKVVLSTTSKKISGNVLTGIDNGHIFELEDGKTINSLNLSASSLPEYQNIIELWKSQYNNIASTFDANTGEQPPSGTPLGTTQLLNSVANSPFEYQREVWGIWLQEILNDWIMPELKKRIIKEHYLVSDFSDEELDLIDKAIATEHVNTSIIDQVFAGGVVTPEDQQGMMQQSMQALKKQGKKREIKVPEGFLDVEGKLTANITGELKNKGAVLQSLDSVFKTVVSSFNPDTGQYAALQDPVLSKVFAQIVEMSGIPFSSIQLQGATPSPMQPKMAQPQLNG